MLTFRGYFRQDVGLHDTYAGKTENQQDTLTLQRKTGIPLVLTAQEPLEQTDPLGDRPPSDRFFSATLLVHRLFSLMSLTSGFPVHNTRNESLKGEPTAAAYPPRMCPRLQSVRNVRIRLAPPTDQRETNRRKGKVSPTQPTAVLLYPWEFGRCVGNEVSGRVAASCVHPRRLTTPRGRPAAIF